MLTAVLAAIAVASQGAQDSAGTVAQAVTVTDYKLSDPVTNNSVQSIQVAAPRTQSQPGLDVHIRPIDPAGDLMLKLFSA
jgi:hypothetical protein